MRLGNNRIGLLGFLLVIIIAAISSYLEGPKEPPRAGGNVSVRRPVPTPSPQAPAKVPEINIKIGERHDATGTAFAIGTGVWMTARHVVDECDVVGILEPSHRAVRARSFTVHDNADVAIMRIDESGPPVRFADVLPEPGDNAYHVGFPHGVPGEMFSRMLGVTVMNARGRYSTREPVIAWAEQARYPYGSGRLSGLSGGPVFDNQGQLVGVHVAGSVRRGRSFTAHPSSIRDLLARSGVTPTTDGPAINFTPVNWPAVADTLRARETVVKALCDVR